MRILFVITEHEGGLTPERQAGYDAIRRRIASLAGAAVDSSSYWEVEAPAADALILSGSADPWAAHSPARLDRFYEVLHGYPGPVLGICAGMQMLAMARGGAVAPAKQGSRGFMTVDVVDGSDLLAGLGTEFDVYQNHEDEVAELPRGFRLLARSETCGIEAIAADDRPWWGTQFHPEAFESARPAGRTILERFLQLAGVEIAPAESGAS